MNNFNINTARTTLLKLDFVSLIVSGVTILISGFISSIIRIPDVATIMKFTFILSLVIFIKSIFNIKEYITKSDSLYKFL